MASLAQAQGESSTKVTAPPATDVDQLLTTDQMRAAAGSKSMYSIRSSLSYSGSSVKKPLSKSRPNLSGTTGSTDYAALGGEVAAQYNLRPVHSLLLGAGVRWITPLESEAPSDYEGDRTDFSNPYLTYQYVYNWRGLESIFQCRLTQFSNSDLIRRGYAQSITLSQDSNYQVPGTRLSVGFSFWTQVSRYTKKGALGSPSDDFYMEDVREDQSDYGLGIDPSLQLQISDRFDLNTSLELWAFEHLRSSPNRDVYQRNTVTQSVGIGISMTRDIYLNPNINFVPDDIRSDRTNVALSADINIF